MAGRRGPWKAVDALVDAAPGLSDLRVHRLHLLAARRWRSLGRPVPSQLVDEERLTAFRVLAVPALLARVRRDLHGPLVLLKGPELADRYPDPALRPLRDLDLLVEDAEAAQAALLRAGWIEVGDPELYLDIHHLRPLAWPGLPLPLELHSRPKWPDGLPGPEGGEIVEAAVPARAGVEGILAPSPGHHTLLVAAHSWAHTPLRSVGDLIDVALLAEGVDPIDLSRVARAWRLERIWTATQRAVAALLFAQRPSGPLLTWARNLPRGRERTVLENHLERWLSPFSAWPPGRALAASAEAVRGDLRPAAGESRREKLFRVRRALSGARAPLSAHQEVLGKDAAKRRRV